MYTPRFAMGSCVSLSESSKVLSKLTLAVTGMWNFEGSKLELWVFPTVDAHGLLLTSLLQSNASTVDSEFRR
jgi:hypothetical protein